jgi:hypothetical protein
VVSRGSFVVPAISGGTMDKCYLPACLLPARWLVSPTDAPDEDRGACEKHLPRAVSRVARKHHGSPVALTPRFVIQTPSDLAALLPLVEMGATIHGLIADTSRASELAARDGTRTATHLTALPSRSSVEQELEQLPIRYGREDVTDV